MGAATGLINYLGTAAQTFTKYRAEGLEGGFRIAQADSNQRLANQAAADATARGATTAARTRMKGTQVAGAQRVAFAASGVDPGVGTAADVQGNTAALSEVDAQTIENNAAREAWGYKTQAANFGQQSKFEKDRTNSQLVGTLISGAIGAAGSAPWGSSS